jgi:hypothetical protein
MKKHPNVIDPDAKFLKFNKRINFKRKQMFYVFFLTSGKHQ